MMLTKSKFRTSYIARIFVIYGVILLFILYFKALKPAGIEYELRLSMADLPFLLGVFLVFFILCVFSLYPLNRMCITEKGIILKKLVTGKETFITYNEITHTEGYAAVERTGRSGPVSKVCRMHIYLTNGKIITFDDDRYENYLALVLSIRENIEESRS